MKTIICKTCLKDFSYEPIFFPGTQKEIGIRKHCDECIPKLEQEANQAEALRIEAERVQEWDKICPPLYRDTDRSKLVIKPATIDKVLKWSVGPKGIALAGKTGAGKTRTMFLLLHKLHTDGHRVMAMSAKKFEGYCHRMFEKDDDARDRLRMMKRAEILFIDDVGKEKFTERVESEFYDLIETRTSHLRPILWTCNTNGAGLIAMMSADRGEPIVRRLKEFTQIETV